LRALHDGVFKLKQINMEKSNENINVYDIRIEMVEVFRQLRAGTIGLNEVKAASNVSGKINASAKLQMEYNKYAQSKAKVKYLTSDV